MKILGKLEKCIIVPTDFLTPTRTKHYLPVKESSSPDEENIGLSGFIFKLTYFKGEDNSMSARKEERKLFE